MVHLSPPVAPRSRHHRLTLSAPYDSPNGIAYMLPNIPNNAITCDDIWYISLKTIIIVIFRNYNKILNVKKIRVRIQVETSFV